MTLTLVTICLQPLLYFLGGLECILTLSHMVVQVFLYSLAWWFRVRSHTLV